MSKKHKKEKKKKEKKKEKKISKDGVDKEEVSPQGGIENENKIAEGMDVGKQDEQQPPTQPTSSFSWEAAFAQVSSIQPAEGLEDDDEFFKAQQQQQQQKEGEIDGESGIAKVAELVKSCHKTEKVQEEDVTKTSKTEEGQDDDNDSEKNKKEKKKSKKKKKHKKEKDDGDKDAGLVEEDKKDMDEENKSDDNDNKDSDSKSKTKKEKKKKEKKNKKRKREEVENDAKEEEDNDDGKNETKKSKKEKKKKKSKKKEKEETGNDDKNSITDQHGEDHGDKNEGVKDSSSPPPSPLSSSAPLEGRMVPLPPRSTEMIMVLIDRKKNVVYTMPPASVSTDKDDAGDEKENKKMVAVGILNDKKEVVLDEEKLYWLDNSNAEKKENSNSTADTENSISPSFPYKVEPDDHCETPLESYEDIAPLLEKLKSSVFMKENNNDVAIYDPYYCDGSVISNLSKLGFPNVYNKKEDCYAVWKTGVGYPNFDVLVTNPPYSEDHIEKLIRHITSPQFGNRPWFLLLPKFVHKKDYYKKALWSAYCTPFYLVPKKRYVYVPPKNFRAKKASDVHKKSSPFVSMWYIWGGSEEVTQMLADYYYQRSRNMNGDSDTSVFGRCDVARSQSQLRDLRRKSR